MTESYYQDVVGRGALDCASEQRNAGFPGSDAQCERDAAENLRQTIHQFYCYLRSLPRNARIDLSMFFPGSKMGDISKLRPVELLGRGESLLRALDAEHCRDFPNAQMWMTELIERRSAVDENLSPASDPQVVSGA